MTLIDGWFGDCVKSRIMEFRTPIRQSAAFLILSRLYSQQEAHAE